MNDITNLLRASREFQVDIGVQKYKLTLPSEHAIRVAIERHRNNDGQFMEAAAMRELLDYAVQDWSGVLTSAVIPGADDSQFEFSKFNAALLLDERQDIADQLAVKMWNMREERTKKLRTAEKN